MISVVVAMPGADEGVISQPSGPGEEHSLVFEVGLPPLPPLHSETVRTAATQRRSAGCCNLNLVAT